MTQMGMDSYIWNFGYLKPISLSFRGLCVSFKVKMFRVTWTQMLFQFAFCSSSGVLNCIEAEDQVEN